MNLRTLNLSVKYKAILQLILLCKQNYFLRIISNQPILLKEQMSKVIMGSIILSCNVVVSRIDLKDPILSKTYYIFKK